MKFTPELLKRNDKKVQALLKETGNRIETSTNVSIIFPSRFLDKNLAKIAASVEVVGAVMVMTEKHDYTVISLPNLISFSPNSVETINIDDKEHIIMGFTAPSFISSMTVIDSADELVEMINDFFIKNNAPFYFSMLDAFKLLEKGSRTTSSKLTKNILIPELLTALVMKDRVSGKPSRSILSKDEQNDISKAAIIGLANISGLNNNIAKMMGSYFSEGLDSILADESEQEETKLEKILKY